MQKQQQFMAQLGGTIAGASAIGTYMGNMGTINTMMKKGQRQNTQNSQSSIQGGNLLTVRNTKAIVG